MNSVIIAIFALAAFSLAYRVYGRYLATRVFDSEGAEAESFETPAHRLRDDVDYVPSPRPLLFGHHFTSIAGAGPIVGPAIAVIWGWVPAVLWIVFGAIFIGAVHDFGCLVASARSGGRSMAEITGDLVGNRTRLLFLVLVVFLTWIVLAVFAFVIASLFVDYPASVIPVNFEILVALLLGYGVHRKGLSLTLPSLVALAALYAMVFVGVHYPVVSHEAFLDAPQLEAITALEASHGPLGSGELDVHRVKPLLAWLAQRGDAELALAEAVTQARGQAISAWMYALLGYSFVACVLPVWLLLQPRDYINSHQLMVGLGGLYLGLLLVHPPIVAPAFVAAPEGAPPWFPFIFVTIACGAISGFHGLVSSGTSSKQLDRLPDARPVGYLAMLGEATLGLIVVLSCVAGFDSSQAWSEHYQSWAHAASLDRKLDAFLSGGSVFLGSLGLPLDVGVIIIAVIVISFAATTLDSAARVQRFVLSELGERVGGPLGLLKHRLVAASVACASPLLLLNARTAEGKPLWTVIWPIFGAANQLLGALCLLTLSVWLAARKRAAWVTLFPFMFIALITSWAFTTKLRDFWLASRASDFQEGKVVLAVTALLFACGVWISVEALAVLRRSLKANSSAASM